MPAAASALAPFPRRRRHERPGDPRHRHCGRRQRRAGCARPDCSRANCRRRPPHPYWSSRTQIGTIGVGEATIPANPRQFNANLCASMRDEFMPPDTSRYLQAGYRVRQLGQGSATRISTGSARSGAEPADWPSFYQYWLQAVPGRRRCRTSNDFCHQHRRSRARAQVHAPSRPTCLNSPLADYRATRSTSTLACTRAICARYSEAVGRAPHRRERWPEPCCQRPADGFIEARWCWTDGQQYRWRSVHRLFRAGARLLIEQTLHTGYEDWSGYLPCRQRDCRALRFENRIAGALHPLHRA